MKNFFRLLVVSLIAFFSFSSSGQVKPSDESVLWQDNFSKVEIDNDKARKGWKLKDITEETVNNLLRIRESGPKSWGEMYRYLPFDLRNGQKVFLQIKLGHVENFKNFLSASNISTDGETFGKLFTGWNTFDLTSQSNLQNRKGTFALGLQLVGINGKKPGGWLDIALVRIVKTPFDGLTMSLLSDAPDKTAGIGTKILFRYYSSTKPAVKTIPVKLFISPAMHDYQINNSSIVLNDDGQHGDEKADDGIYSCASVIDKNAISFKTDKSSRLIATVKVNGIDSTGTAPFLCDIVTEKKLPKPVIKGGTPDAIFYRKLWDKRSVGNNLALGKKVKFSRLPTCRETVQKGTDLTDLTDGKVTSRNDGAIWFDPRTVGWYNDKVTNGVNCLIDLENVEPVDRIVLRSLAGKCQGGLSSPKKFEVFVSKDGVNFYKTVSMQKLMPGEKSQSDFVNYYYLEETGRPYVYPFEFKVNADTRYIGITVIGADDAVFIDEVVALKSTPEKQKGTEFNSAYKKSPQKFHTEGIIVKPRMGTLVISSNIYTPNSFAIFDMRSKDLASKKATIKIDLPESAKILSPVFPKEPIEIEGGKYLRWSVPLVKYAGRPQTQMMFIDPGNGNIDGKNAYFSVECEGIKPIKSTAPIKIVQIPEVSPQFKKLHIGLAWMSIGAAKSWPDFFKAWKVLGFNSVACFPYYWKGIISEKNKAFLDEARKNGMTVVANESPFHMMMRGHKAGAEIFSKTSKPNRNLCPSYRGEYYDKEIERVGVSVKLTKPDYVFWDIECWYRGAKEAHSCERCVEGQKKSGKDMDEYLKDLGTETMKDLYEAVKKASEDEKMPIVGSYNHHAAHPVHHIILDFNRFYPQYVKMAMPSLYVVGRALDVHKSVRKNYKLLKKKEIIPWLSTGCYGEFDPYLLEYMILEALMNGSSGITYYWYGNFDTPMDFYYHAKALKQVAPYENLIVEGDILNPEGSNKDLTYSGIKKDDEMLLLIGNYKWSDPETTIKLPFKEILEIKDLRNNKKVPNQNPLKINIPKGDIIFYWIKGTQQVVPNDSLRSNKK